MKTSNIIQLYTAYEQEWQYRDSHFWKVYFKMFFAELIINLTPLLYKEYCPETVPLIIFPIIGIIMNFIFLYVILAMHSRYVAAGNVLKRINDMLEEKYRREVIKGILGRRLLPFVIVISFCAFLILSIVIMHLL